MRLSHHFRHHTHFSGSLFGGRWFRRGLLLMVIPLGAMACGRHHHHNHNATEAEVKENALEHADDLVDWLDGTEAQKTQIKQVVNAAVPDLMAFRDEHRALRVELQKELSAPTINPAALEGLRVKALKMMDDATARGLRALTDVATVLTPEQRQKAIGKWKKFSG
jgi:Spy/CpxP family protein refolding chaperone